ncbi:hypothetical protein OsI_28035 [Oryza sativa Indica Group]|uniref:Uncharacterized protein n=1 Tax=Oryza sativa subsp. indica TaxID=39946 RepID=B8BBC7_ORYSI|nr:hypothetical protein OsI_28035 [Oryza sativa Indica Group]
MSLAYVSRLCARAVQAAVRAEQPATTRRRPPHARRPPPPSSGGGSPAEVAPAAKSVAEEKARRLRRRAEKDEKEFGPQKEMNMNARSDSSSLFLRLRSSSSSSAAFAALIACLDDSEPPAAAAALSFAFHVVAAPPSRVFPAGAGAGDGATRAPPTRPANLTLIAAAAAAAKLFAFLGEVKGEEAAAVAVLVVGAVRWAAPLVTPAKRRAKAQTCPRFSPHAAS